MARAIDEHPSLRLNVNVVPSLLLQIEEIGERGHTDLVLEISRRDPATLSEQEKRFILHTHFLCQVDLMIAPYPRYAELYQRYREWTGSGSDTIDGWSDHDFRDLQVWYLLAWIGAYEAENEPFASAIAKGSGFDENEKRSIIDASIELVRNVIPLFRALGESGRVELSTTPFYHPIMPLLLDFHEAVNAAPGTPLPAATSGWKEDVALQLDGARRYHEKLFGTAPLGCWPSEGSLSTKTLQMLNAAGFEWTASDQELLRRTLGRRATETSHYYPWHFTERKRSLGLLFRDHEISDLIGFVYATWDPIDAARDLVRRMLDVRETIRTRDGEEALEKAVLPIILDGENCWEYYQENGRPFLRELYRLLTSTPELSTVCVSDLFAAGTVDPHRSLSRLSPGSWIDGNFRIWIGGQEENRAWELVAAARSALMSRKGVVDLTSFHTAYEDLMIAEGSDWFWWFGEDNNSANDLEFDRLFRERLRKIYRGVGLEPPAELDLPICSADAAHINKHGTGAMHRWTT